MIYAFSQSVSILFSIEWRKEKQMHFSDYGFQSNPYLNIRYQNNTNVPIYFLKPSVNQMGLPPITRGTLSKSNDIDKLHCYTINHYDYSKDRYKVEIYGSPFYNQNWEVFPDTADITKEHETISINDKLSDIYKCIILKQDSIKYLDSTFYYEYKSTDITEKSILTKLKDHFCFLKAGEATTDRYNLIGFLIVGGYFDFSINTDHLYEYVYSDSFWDNKQEKWCYMKTKLPNKINGYDLYYGEFYTNSFSVMFENSIKNK